MYVTGVKSIIVHWNEDLNKFLIFLLINFVKSDQDFLFQGRKINCCLIIITGTGIMIFFLKICFEIHVYVHVLPMVANTH